MEIVQLLDDLSSGNRESYNTATESLINLLTDEDEAIRAKISLLLHELTVKDDPPILKALISAMKSKNEDNRFRAIEALKQIADPLAIEALIAVMNSKYNVEEIGAISKIRIPYEGPTLIDWVICNQIIEMLGQSGDPSVIKPLLKISGSDDNDDYFSVILDTFKALGDLTIDPLINSLDNEDQAISVAASRFLGELGDVRAVDPLIKRTNKTEIKIQKFAIESLGHLGDNRAVEPLIKILSKKDENWLVRETAAKTLGYLGNHEAVEILIETLTCGDENELIRKTAARALGRIGTPDVVDSLVKTYVMTQKKDLLTTIINVLVKIKAPVIPLLIQLLSSTPEEKMPFLNNALQLFLRWANHREQVRQQLFPLKSFLTDISLSSNEDVKKSSQALLDMINH